MENETFLELQIGGKLLIPKNYKGRSEIKQHYPNLITSNINLFEMKLQLPDDWKVLQVLERTKGMYRQTSDIFVTDHNNCPRIAMCTNQQTVSIIPAIYYTIEYDLDSRLLYAEVHSKQERVWNFYEHKDDSKVVLFDSDILTLLSSEVIATRKKRLIERVEKHLTELYPKWKDPIAYWDSYWTEYF